MATQVTKHEVYIEDLTAHLRSAEREITRARDELKAERNYSISIEDSFTATLEEEARKKVAEAVVLANIQAEEERERAVEMATAKYSDTF